MSANEKNVRPLDPSTELAMAMAQLEVLIDRWEPHSEDLCRVFGGVEYTDVHALHAIERTVRRAKQALDDSDEVAGGAK